MLPVLASPCSCVGSRDPRPRTLLLAAGKRCSRHSPRYHGRLRRRPFRHPTSNAGNSCGYCVHHPRTPASRAAAAADRTRVLRAAACAGAQPSDGHATVAARPPISAAGNFHHFHVPELARHRPPRAARARQHRSRAVVLAMATMKSASRARIRFFLRFVASHPSKINSACSKYLTSTNQPPRAGEGGRGRRVRVARSCPGSPHRPLLALPAALPPACRQRLRGAPGGRRLWSPREDAHPGVRARRAPAA